MSARVGAAELGLLAAAVLAALVLGEAAAFAGFRRQYARQFALAVAVAQRDGRVPDRRSRNRVVRDLRAHGDSAFAPIRVPVAVGGAMLEPLAGVGHVTTVLCNEDGRHQTYRSDVHGFNNADTSWAAPANVLIGDSYVHGMCDPPDSIIAAALARALPGTTLNLGYAGNGPLRDLATIREYASVLRPRRVVWFYYDNDLMDLQLERRVPALMAYLARGHRQELAAHQASLDSALGRAFEVALTAAEWEEAHPVRSHLPDMARLYYLRDLLGLSGLFRGPDPCCDVRLLTRVLAEADTTVRSWGGALSFVYLPARERFGGPPWLDRKALAARPAVLEAARGVGLPVLDLEPVLRRRFADPQAAFVHPFGHLTGEAAAAVAGSVAAFLAPRGSR